MPRYYIRSVDPDGHQAHESSAYAADLGGALSLAQRLAVEMIRSGPRNQTWRGWSIDVADGSGHLLLNFPVSATPRHQPSAP